jgi:hypothetical protein
MAGKLSSPLSSPCTDLRQLIQAVFHQLTSIAFLLYGTRLCFKHRVYAVLPSHVSVFLNYMCCAFFMCSLRGFFVLVFHNVISYCNHTGVLHCNWIPLLMILMLAMVLSLPVNHKHRDAL